MVAIPQPPVLERPAHNLNFESYQQAISTTFVPLKLSSDRESSFTGSVKLVDAASVGFSLVSGGTHQVERTVALSRQTPRACYKLSMQLRGEAVLRQGDREAVLTPGDFALYDTDVPYSLSFAEETDVLVMMFPQALADLPRPRIAEMTAVPLAGSSRLGTAVSRYLAGLAQGLEEFTSGSAPRVAQASIELVMAMLAGELDVTRGVVDRRWALFEQVTGYIERKLDSPDLTPALIAAAHFMSLRSLHALFHDCEETVSGWIRTRRLQHCRRDLADPYLSGRSIMSIASHWGFSDPAHFSRAFRREYGCAPGELRPSPLRSTK